MQKEGFLRCDAETFIEWSLCRLHRRSAVGFRKGRLRQRVFLVVLVLSSFGADNAGVADDRCEIGAENGGISLTSKGCESCTGIYDSVRDTWAS